MSSQVIISGSRGFIGTHVSRRLRGLGVSCKQIDRDGVRDDREPGYIQPRPLTVDDYSNFLAGSSALVWLACASTPRTSEHNPLKEADENIRPFLTMLEALHQHPQCHLVFVSTGGAMYGDIAGDGIAREDWRIQPKSYYSAGKAALEHFASAFATQTGGRVTIIRPSNVYGPGQPYRPGFGIIPAAFHALLQQEKFPIWGDGGAVRDYLYIQDFVDLCMQILDKPPTDSPSLVHASSGIGIRLDALLDEIEGAAGRKILRDLTPDHAVDVSRVVLCNDESRKRYDWSPTTSLPEGLQRAWAWYSEHGA